ncbi:MAG TPA: NTP transferase domain-containing protein [Candidatus Krumholzibacteria bacterium]|nr:NTP transferase domain-containing protein [Candidatus Krumholzibacteria bacterium]
MTQSGLQVGAVILAAGQGKRMQSDLPKVLHAVGGRPMVLHVVDAVRAVGADPVVVVTGYQAERVETACADARVQFARQAEQLGTGHAVMQAEALISGRCRTVLVLNGDVPGLRPATIRAFVEYHRAHHAVATVLTAVLDDSTGYGRIVRDGNGALLRIVEERDAVAGELVIREINSGLFCFDVSALFPALKRVTRRNAQNEYYVTDVIGLLASEGSVVAAYRIEDAREVAGVNNPGELDAVRRFVTGQP